MEKKDYIFKSSVNSNGEIHGLYNLKAICALFVVIYHVPLLWGKELTPLTGVAVPCFFMISGYFLYVGMPNNEIKKAKRWLRKILFITVILNVFYLFVNYDEVLSRYECSWRFYVPLFFQGGLISGVLWYLTAFWEALVVFIIVRHYFSSKLFYVAPFLLVIGLYAGKYGFLCGRYELKPWLFQSFLSAAIPYMSIGYLVRKHRICFVGLSKWMKYFVLFYILIYVERWILTHYFYVRENGTFYLFTMPLALSLFIIALNSEKYTCKILSWIGKEHSSNIYFFHMFLYGESISLFCYIMGCDIYMNVAALLVYFISILFSFLLSYVCMSAHALWSMMIQCKNCENKPND